MKIYIKNIREADCVCDALVLPSAEKDTTFHENLHPSISSLIKRLFLKEFSGKQNEVLLLPAPDDIKAERILLVGLGRKDQVSAEKVRQAGGKASGYLRDMGMKSIALSTVALSSFKISPSVFIEGALLGLYKFNRYKAGNNNRKIDGFTLLSKASKGLDEELKWAGTLCSSVNFTRDMVNTPANDMTPTHLAKAALSLKGKKLTVKVLEAKDAKKLGMGAYLSVARGSEEPSRFIVLEYKGTKAAPVVLIGKAITFDSGGISLKPAESMEKMKYDMAGGAAVLGIFKAVSELELPVHIVGILPATENLPGGAASKPGDVIRTIEGKTVEIINTDAEGRLVIADAIGYAKRFNPRLIIDIATLTGACSIALGNEAMAMAGNNGELLDKMRESAHNTYERVWEIPLYEEYREYLKSDIADIKNSGGKNGSLVTSAYFLHEFTGDVPWAHLDIAGTAWVDKEKPYIPKGASGIGVRLILDLLRRL